jgi:CRP-like cAMP-binding protein
VRRGQEVIREGDVATFGVLVVSGTYEIMKWLDGQKVTLALAKRGSFIGDTGLFSCNPSYASCRAIESGDIGLLTQQRLSVMYKEVPTLYTDLLANFNRILSNRIIRINEYVLNISDESLNSKTARKIVGNSIFF